VLPLLEVAVADGWRNRYMAPFYALIISFALVLLLGSVLKKDTPTGSATSASTTRPPTTEPPTTQPQGTFSAKDSKGFPGSDLTLVYDDQMKQFRDLGKIPAVPLDEKYAICAVLDDGWTAVDAMRAPDSEYSCWGPFDPKSDKPFALRVEAAK